MSKTKDLDPESPEYWDQVLMEEGLGVYRGRNTDKVSLVGDLNDLVNVEIARAEPRAYGGRKVKPEGKGPEW